MHRIQNDATKWPDLSNQESSSAVQSNTALICTRVTYTASV